MSDAPDFKETCLYRGTEPGFQAEEPLLCTLHDYFVEDDLNLYYYIARYLDTHGNASDISNEVTGRYPTDVGVPVAKEPVLRQNKPNPFNPITTIEYSLTEPARVTLQIFDISGRLVRTLVRASTEEAGHHEVAWHGKGDSGTFAASGTYFYRLTAGGYTETRRMVLVK
jgi:hypothetical protein